MKGEQRQADGVEGVEKKPLSPNTALRCAGFIHSMVRFGIMPIPQSPSSHVGKGTEEGMWVPIRK